MKTRFLFFVLLVFIVLSGCGLQGQPETTPVDKIQPAIQNKPASELSGELSTNSPWLLLQTEDGLWGMNPDGSGLTQLMMGKPYNIAVSPNGRYVAYLSFGEYPQRGFIDVMVNGIVEARLWLTTPETEPPVKPGKMCDPKDQAARALSWGSNMAWSPDGETLAFIGLMEGSSADVYIFKFADRSMTRLSDENFNAADIHWSPSGKYLEYFGVSCFGSGMGVGIEKVYVMDMETLASESAYTVSSNSDLETFIGWTNEKTEAFLVSSRDPMSGCKEQLRMIDPKDKSVTMIYKGCFEDAAMGRGDALAILTAGGFLKSPAARLYTQPQENLKSVHYRFSGEAERIVYDANSDLFLIQSGSESGREIYSMDGDGRPGWYQGKDSFPAFSSGGEFWAWNEGDKFRLYGKEIQAPIELNDAPGLYAVWFEDNLYFFDKEDRSLYLFSASDYSLTPLADNLDLVSTPIIIR